MSGFAPITGPGGRVIPVVSVPNLEPGLLVRLVADMVEELGDGEYGRWVVGRGIAVCGSRRPVGIRKRRQARDGTNCYANAGALALKDEQYTYCEGYALLAPRDMVARRFTSPFASLSRHAWCLTTASSVVDVTYDHPERGAYLGVALEGGPEAVARLGEKPRSWGPWGPW
jgi:hypothetical protein